MRVSVLLTAEVSSSAAFDEIEQACVVASRSAGLEAIGKVGERRAGRAV